MMILIFLSIVFLKISFLSSVEIEFIVNKVPKYYTPLFDPIFISGSFNNWIPNDPNFKLEKIGLETYRLVTNLPVGVHLFKITRGSWDTVETNGDGIALDNRILPIISQEKLTVSVSIKSWSDFLSTHSAVGNTHILSNSYPYPQFNTTKRIWIYLPSDYYTSNKTYSVIYMHDGQNLFDKRYSIYSGVEWEIDETMEKFYNIGKQTSIVVGIETNENRGDELSPFPNLQEQGGKSDLYYDFLINDLKPFVDRNFRTKSDRENTGIIGSSRGGLAAFYGGIKHQNIFSKVGSFSPSFWFSEGIFTFTANETQKYDDFRMFFVCGDQETQFPTLIQEMNRMINLIRQLGFNQITSSIIPNGIHSEIFWQKEFPRAYEYLFN